MKARRYIVVVRYSGSLTVVRWDRQLGAVRRRLHARQYWWHRYVCGLRVLGQLGVARLEYQRSGLTAYGCGCDGYLDWPAWLRLPE